MALTNVIEFNRQELEAEIERLSSRIAELEGMITLQQKEEIKRVALQKQFTFEQVVREALDAYLLQCTKD